jgi:hypothetical protein
MNLTDFVPGTARDPRRAQATGTDMIHRLMAMQRARGRGGPGGPAAMGPPPMGPAAMGPPAMGPMGEPAAWGGPAGGMTPGGMNLPYQFGQPPDYSLYPRG